METLVLVYLPAHHIDAAAFNRIERLIISPPARLARPASSSVQSGAQQMIIKTQPEQSGEREEQRERERGSDKQRHPDDWLIKGRVASHQACGSLNGHSASWPKPSRPSHIKRILYQSESRKINGILRIISTAARQMAPWCSKLVAACRSALILMICLLWQKY